MFLRKQAPISSYTQPRLRSHLTTFTITRELKGHIAASRRVATRQRHQTRCRLNSTIAPAIFNPQNKVHPNASRTQPRSPDLPLRASTSPVSIVLTRISDLQNIPRCPSTYSQKVQAPSNDMHKSNSLASPAKTLSQQDRLRVCNTTNLLVLLFSCRHRSLSTNLSRDE